MAKEYLLDIYGVAIGSLWDIYRVAMEYLWVMAMGWLWGTYGTSICMG